MGPEGYKTRYEALQSLARDLLVNAWEDQLWCCRKSKKEFPNHMRCHRCGKKLNIQSSLQEDWKRHLYEMNKYILDDLGDELEEWWPYDSISKLLDFSKDEMLIIDDCGENFLFEALDGTEFDGKYKKEIEQYWEHKKDYANEWTKRTTREEFIEAINKSPKIDYWS
jgi:hypothetical protein